MADTKPKLPASDIVRLIAAIDERSEIRAEQVRIWVTRLRLAAGKLVTAPEPDPDVASVFWIRLYGVLDEMLGSYKLFDGIATAQAQGLARRACEVRDAILALKAEFTEDELIYIQYRRDVEGHVWQDAYELTGHVNQPKLNEDRKHPLLGNRRITHVDFDKRVRALLRTYRINELAIAVAFAHRTLTKIEAVAVALVNLDRP